jgi:type VI protein secretion system component VasK
MHLAAEFGTGQVLWDILWLFMFIIWFWLLIMVFGDIFRSHDMGGFAKTLWIIFVIITPYLGVFIYLIVRGRSMSERNMAAMQQAQQAQADYIKSVAGSGGTSAAEELTRLADLRDKGVLSEEEFQSAKAKVIS